MCVCLMYARELRACGPYRGLKRTLELELQATMNHHLGAAN